MERSKVREEVAKVNVWKANLEEIASEVPNILPPRKARAAQHYIYQVMVMLLAHRAMLDGFLSAADQWEADHPDASDDEPF